MLIDFTKTMKNGMKVFDGDPVFCAKRHATIAEIGCNLHSLSMGTHTGTHLDVPFHFIENGKTVDELPLSLFTGSAEVVTLKNITYPDCEFLIVYTNKSHIPYDVAEEIIKRGYKGIAIDTDSIDSDGNVHRLLLQNEIIIFENLDNLEYNIEKKGTFHACPLKLYGCDGSPVRAYLDWSPEFDGAIFDVDGTILDSMYVWNEATTNFYKNHGLTLTAEEADTFAHQTLDESLPYIKKTYNLPMSVEEISLEFKELIRDSYSNKVKEKDYAVQYIKKLHNSGIKIAIATSGIDEMWQAAFKRLGILDLITTHSNSKEVGVNKSNPDVYLLAAKRLGIAPEKCMVFEDIYPGICGAKKGGFLTCAIYDTLSKNDTENMKKDADIYINSWREIL